MKTAQSDAVAAANAHLTNAGLPSYTEIVALLNEAAKLGLDFDIGTAYIRRSHIDQQTELVRRIRENNKVVLPAIFSA